MICATNAASDAPSAAWGHAAYNALHVVAVGRVPSRGVGLASAEASG
jgi:hypothetical protein